VSKPEMPLAPLLAALRDLMSWFEKSKAPGIVIGGVAASVLGRPRFTRDVDALVLLEPEQWKNFLESGEEAGFAARRPDALRFAARTRVLLVRHQTSAIDVDISFGALPFEEECLLRGKWKKVGGIQVKLPSPEDLIIMKAVAHRPRDLQDIEAILGTHPKLKVERVRRWVSEFAAVLEMPELLEDLDKLLRRNIQGSARKRRLHNKPV
jgi:hypothetical protein